MEKWRIKKDLLKGRIEDHKEIVPPQIDPMLYFRKYSDSYRYIHLFRFTAGFFLPAPGIGLYRNARMPVGELAVIIWPILLCVSLIQVFRKRLGSGLLLAMGIAMLLCPKSLWAEKSREASTLRQARNGVYVIAHRGAHKGIPENSVAACKRAVHMGCDFVEIDVRMSKDGTLVNFHDARVSTVPGTPPVEIREMTLDELKQIDIGRGFGRKWKNTRIPGVEEIFEICRGKSGVYLDLKDAPISRVVELVRQYRMETDVVWYIPARRIDQIRELSELCPECILMPDPGKDPGIDQMLKTVPARVVATDMKVLDLSFVEKVHRSDALVFVDELRGTKKEWRQILAMGVDGIQTDDPGKLISFLRRRGYAKK